MSNSVTPSQDDRADYPSGLSTPSNYHGTAIDKLVRIFAGTMVVTAILFLVNVYLTFGLQWPSMMGYFEAQQWFGFSPPKKPLDDTAMTQGMWQMFSYIGAALIVCAYVLSTPSRALRADASLLSGFSRYIIRASFWAVFLVGLADMSISFLRVENMLHYFVDSETIKALGRPIYRGLSVHYPLIALAFVIALFTRSLGFTWLALLVVFAEFQIVILRFIFSYEQAFMGDLVRFWYAALFLFASAHTLVCEGHVRVDVLYAQFSIRAKAWANTFGLIVLGLPLCWIILTMGMWGKGNSINSPIFSFEVSQSGYGLYVKYMMVGYLVVFALSMIVQFSSYLLSNIADLRGEVNDEPVVTPSAH